MPLRRSRLGFRIHTIRLASDGLPNGAPPLRFVHLSDVHMHWLRRRHRRLSGALRELEPDFVFLTGDLFSRNRAAPAEMGRWVRTFDPSHGVFACRGNHELKRGHHASDLKDRMAGWGAELLVNESRLVRTPSGAVRVTGLDDLERGWPDFDSTLGEPEPADFHILLSHAPLAARLLPQGADVELVLSGHTHAGQMRIPGLWRLFLPGFHGGFTHGLYRLDRGHVYVNRGFGGVDMWPVRFRCPPDVALFEVSPDGAATAPAGCAGRCG